MFLPSIVSSLPLAGSSERYVKLALPTYEGGTVIVTTFTEDGVATPGDCMVHLPGVSFAAYGYMQIMG